MTIDIRKHAEVRSQVKAGILALLVQSRQIWGDTRHELPEIAHRLMVGVGDIARVVRDKSYYVSYDENTLTYSKEVKKELGNVILSTIRWADDLGLDILECLDLAIEAQEKFAQSGRPR